MKLFEIITLFPEAFPGTLDLSIIKKARGIVWDMKIHDMREFGIGKHKQVDDQVFGGGAGMLIRPDVIDNAMKNIMQNADIQDFDIQNANMQNARQSIDMQNFEKNEKALPRKIFLSPRGRLLDQPLVEELAGEKSDIILLCGRYEGVDARAIEYFNFEEISIGNYILAGAEAAALVMLEAIIRKLSGVVGNQNSFKYETFSNALSHAFSSENRNSTGNYNTVPSEISNAVLSEISEPRYTRPAKWVTHAGDILNVEEILLSGNHKAIELFQKSRRKGINKESI